MQIDVFDLYAEYLLIYNYKYDFYSANFSAAAALSSAVYICIYIYSCGCIHSYVLIR
jgi:hypothetical protein